ncbi:hypothetical protein [Aureimonas sp. AU22]|uniref:hypothetical protein n=1 Tax=Aureimonas sp. AU22 TaxID=1638162 RepID=UPI0007835B4D|nr:hypothetical protein [Aureimonas sp. AU22]
MANFLDANPDEAGRIRSSAEYLGFVPIVKGGEVVAYVAPDRAPEPTADLTAEDYVVGLETLGCRFSIWQSDGKRGLYEATPILDNTPSAFLTRAQAIRSAFGTVRLREAAEFILARDGEAS